MNVKGDGTELLSRLLSVTQKRQQVIMGNLANVETPGWKRKRVEFESLLADAMGKPTGDPLAVEPEIVTDDLTPGRPDGNNVHMELELNSLRENRLLYQTYAAILNHRFSAIDAALREN